AGQRRPRAREREEFPPWHRPPRTARPRRTRRGQPSSTGARAALGRAAWADPRSTASTGQRPCAPSCSNGAHRSARDRMLRLASAASKSVSLPTFLARALRVATLAGADRPALSRPPEGRHMSILAPDIAIMEKILRSAVVYLFLLVSFRLAGKRLLGQLTAFDLVVLLIISNVLQNAAIGDDTSLGGGLLGAFVIIGLNC